jgi:hypothetical protein
MHRGRGVVLPLSFYKALGKLLNHIPKEKESEI